MVERSLMVHACPGKSQKTKGVVHQVFPEHGVLGFYLPNYLSSYTTLKFQQSMKRCGALYKVTVRSRC